MKPLESATVTVDGLQCSYLTGGAGAPLVLLHGWGQSARMWENILRSLANHFSVYALNLPGFGRSAPPSSAWNTDMYAKFVHDFVVELNLENVSVIGHSFGGRVAYAYAGEYPTKYLVLYSASAPGANSVRRYVCYVTLAMKRIAPRLLWHLHTTLFKSKMYKNEVLLSKPEIRTMLDVYLTTHRIIHAQQPAPLCPMILVYGTHDRLVPLRAAIYYTQRKPDADLIVISGAGHFAHIEKTKEFLTAIKRLLC